MSFTVWIFDEGSGTGWRAAHLDDKQVPVLRAFLEELAVAVGHRAKGVYVEEVYDRELYEKTRRSGEAPVSEGHVFPSAVLASYHLGFKTKVVADAIRHRLELPGIDHSEAGVPYPRGTVKLGGLALCWARDANV